MRNKIKAPTKNENLIIKSLILLGIVSILNFLFFFFDRESIGNIYLFGLLLISLLYGMVKKLYLWYNYSNISVPVKPKKTKAFTVDVLTTYYPGEPRQMVITTLEAILKIKYPHETYLCDEANDSYLKKFCENNGIHHVTREIKVDAKAGNINNALRNLATGEITVILDPDHIPDPDFLDQTIPYFSDPEIGFVQTVQGYYNISETLVARGAAEQTFQFYGPMMMTLNSYGSVNAIGANCVFRRAALDSIGGHSPGLCEDMHTAMQLYAKDWKAVYVPKILAQGLAPSNLTSYFKQQLKWARGTFDLLFNVYPKLFKNFTYRQRIHFGILPLHYLSGLICFINFIIPIISLLFSVTPWKGNFIDFGLVLLPVVVSSILIRTYIQKWVIERKERGFHLIGGLLEINTWWIYSLGFLYTLIDKKIPYLPTPKENEFATNLKIIIPNTVIAVISLTAVYIGLQRDFTPFALVMSGFAIFNALIMVLGIYLTVKTTNENNILKNFLNRKILLGLRSIRFSLRRKGNTLFTFARFAALPLLLILLITSLYAKQQMDSRKWDDISFNRDKIRTNSYLGIYHPDRDTGTVNLAEIHLIEKKQHIDFDIISFYLGWDNSKQPALPRKFLDSIQAKNAIPMITWEPWLQINPEEIGILNNISKGKYDDYIKEFGRELAAFDQPVYLRFAHEFRNPQYPWSKSSGMLEDEFKSAWIHVYEIIKSEGASKVMMVWNPWKAKGMKNFYPGDAYVDWIGFTLLNYGPLNQNGKSVSFEQLYQRFHDKLYWFTRKPVMLAEFGTIKANNDQSHWLSSAAKTLESKFDEISAIVFFNSAFDDNIPEGKIFNEKYIDWTTDSIGLFKPQKINNRRIFDSEDILEIDRNKRLTFEIPPVGVHYRKGLDWRNNYYVLNRKSLLQDFRLMKNNGINTIFYPGGNVYDHNTLKYAEEENIQVIYDFGSFQPEDYLVDKLTLDEAEQEIFDKLEELRTHSNLLAISFDLQPELHFSKPLLFSQREAMIIWYNSLLNSIKFRYPELPLILNLELNFETRYLIEELDRYLPVDYYGLLVNDATYLNETLNYAEVNDIQVFNSSISHTAQKYLDLESCVKVFQNWQDERFSDRLTFDGILDFEGRIKFSFKKFQEDSISNSENKIRILKPAFPLVPGENATYHAMAYANESWISTEKIKGKYVYEWKLIKTDAFLNPLALMDLGKGPKVTFSIPENYENYQLLLTVIPENEDCAWQTRTTLNTPISNKK